MTKETGFLRASQLSPLVGTSMQAANSTARMYERLHREGVRTGHAVGVAGPGGAYRSNADLHDLQAQYLGKPHKKDWHLLPGSGAMPSLYSVHGLGRCLDFTGDVDWIKRVSLDWGLTFPLVNLGDVNHGQHDGKTRGDSGLLPYEVKRLAAYLHGRTHLPIGATTSGKPGAKTTNFWKALRQVVADDHRSGKPLSSHYSHYLDLEARAKAA